MVWRRRSKTTGVSFCAALSSCCHHRSCQTWQKIPQLEFKQRVILSENAAVCALKSARGRGSTCECGGGGGLKVWGGEDGSGGQGALPLPWQLSGGRPSWGWSVWVATAVKRGALLNIIMFGPTFGSGLNRNPSLETLRTFVISSDSHCPQLCKPFLLGLYRKENLSVKLLLQVLHQAKHKVVISNGKQMDNNHNHYLLLLFQSFLLAAGQHPKPYQADEGAHWRAQRPLCWIPESPRNLLVRVRICLITTLMITLVTTWWSTFWSKNMFTLLIYFSAKPAWEKLPQLHWCYIYRYDEWTQKLHRFLTREQNIR